MPAIPSQPVPRWLHAWAVLTVIVAATLLLLGGAVTTLQAGMADPDWPTYPWALLITSWDLGRFDWVVEHSHRAAGYTVGLLVIVLAVGLWATARRRWLVWLGLAALLGVIAQGVLGGMRVRFDESMGSTLKAVHGCFAPVVFSLLVGLAVLTASSRTNVVLSPGLGRRCFRAALTLTALAFLQIVWGVLVRHTHSRTAQRLHVLTAFAVVAAVVWLIQIIREGPASWQVFGRAAIVLTILLVVQLSLGVEAWMGQYTGPLPPELQPVSAAIAVVRTAHVLVGAGILATAVVAAMQAYRALAPAEPVTIYSPTTQPFAVPSSHSVNVKGTV
jgi:heme A synthase